VVLKSQMVIANVLYRPVTNIITLKWLETHNNLTAKLASIKVLISTPLKKRPMVNIFH